MDCEKDSCGVCKGREDNDPLEGEEWVECSTCKQWYHMKCVNLKEIPGDGEEWLCHACEAFKLQSNNTVQNEINEDNVLPPNVTSDNSDNCDLERLNLMTELIKEKESLILLKQKQLDVMEKISTISRTEKTRRWCENEPSTSKGANLLNNYTTKKSLNRPSHMKNDSGMNKSEYQNETDVSWLMKKQMQLISQQYLADLPEFNGDEDIWPIFYQQFVTSTDQGCFDDAFNLMRLRKALKGEARQAVAGILALPNCLRDVMSILEKRYGNFDTIVKRKIKKLSSIPPPVENKPQSVKVFYEFILGLHATLNNVNAISYLNSPQMLDSIIEKLPASINRQWIRHKRNSRCRPSIGDFIVWFEPYYDCANECDINKPELPKRIEGRVNLHKESAENKSCKTSAKSANVKQCCFCRHGEHGLQECNDFKKLPTRKRWGFVRKRRLCFRCLKSKHRYENCMTNGKCNVDNCLELHHALLHPSQIKPQQSQCLNLPNDSENEAELNAVVSSSETSLTHFRSLPVIITNPENGKSLTIWAFIDEGSSPTMLSNDIADELQLKGQHEALCTTWTDDSVRKEPNSRRVKVMISGVGLNKKFIMSNVRTVSCLKLPLPTTTEDVVKKFEHLRDIKITNIPLVRPQLLIGLEHAKLGLMYEIREGGWNEPIGTRTRLGWVIHGKQIQKCENSEHFSCHVCECGSNEGDLNYLMRTFQATESFGVKAVEKLIEAKDDIRARKILETSTKKVDTQYETGLLWKRDDVYLPDNKKMALKRLFCFEQKLNRDESLKLAVKLKMSEHIANGYLQKVTADFNQNRHWYLPIFSVQNPNKPAKIRIVFDAAAKCNSICLNDMLLKGPDTLVSLFGIILRFRQRKIAVSADIAEMFHRVKIIQDDQLCQLEGWKNNDLKEKFIV